MTSALSPSDRATLLGLARAAVAHRLGLGPPPAPPPGGALAEPRGVAVSLWMGGAPRASLAALAPAQPLAAAVAALAARAVADDPRGPAVAPSELPALSVRVAALGPARRLAGASSLRVGTEGVAVTRGWNRGVLLPSAAGEGWDGPRFLTHACLAAGLPARAHLDPATIVEAFEAEEFGE
jgi:hypothetical protein